MHLFSIFIFSTNSLYRYLIVKSLISPSRDRHEFSQSVEGTCKGRTGLASTFDLKILFFGYLLRGCRR